jgi:hypothetical protein
VLDIRRVLGEVSGGHGEQLDEEIVAQRRDRFQGHVAGTLHSPFVALLEQELSRQTEAGAVMRRPLASCCHAIYGNCIRRREPTLRPWYSSFHPMWDAISFNPLCLGRSVLNSAKPHYSGRPFSSR